MNYLKISLCLCLLAGTASLLAQSKNTNEEKLADYKSFDFVPGEKTLFFDDFSKGFAQWNKVTWDEWEEAHKGLVSSSSFASGTWYLMPRKGMTAPKNLGALPDQFTVEFDMMSNEEHSESEGGLGTMFIKHSAFKINNYDFYFNDATRLMLDVHPFNTWLSLKAFREYGYTKGFDEGQMIFNELKQEYWKANQVYRVSISKNGSQIKLYVNQDLVIDLPNALPANEKYTFCLGNNSWISGLYISNIRIATGLPEPAKDLKEKKLYITQNIRFASNSDKITANSYPILSQVAQAIKGTEGKIQIVGHTDSDGNADSNLELSQKRAASVKNALVKEFGIDAAKLETDGKGQSKPIDSNDTPQGKANNRRVEFVVMK